MSSGARDNISPRARLESIPDTTPPMYLTQTGIHLRSSTKARICGDLILKLSGTLAQHLEATNVRHREGRSSISAESFEIVSLAGTLDDFLQADFPLQIAVSLNQSLPVRRWAS